MVGGELGVVTPDHTGRGTLHTTSQELKVCNLIGRSVVVHRSDKRLVVMLLYYEHTHMRTHARTDRLLCGVVARSAGLFQNTKKLCTCDGVTIWDEARRAKS